MTTIKPTFDPQTIIDDFPILHQTIHNNRRLVYLDNAASTQRPRQVIEAMRDCYEQTYANVHRGIHYLSEQSTRQYEEVRQEVQQLVGARHPHEIIYTSGTTGGVNLVARSWGDKNVSGGDEIILTEMEHHSNIVPWQQLAERVGAVVRWVQVTDDGHLDLEHYLSLLNEKTRMVAFTALSNTMGTRNPVGKMVAAAHQAGAVTLIDAAQHVPHQASDFVDWNADFVVFSPHKMLGPSGIGILYGKEQLLDSMPPFLGGGSMISTVTRQGFTPGELPAKFEAGTPPIAETIGLGAAIDYLREIGLESIAEHEYRLVKLAMSRLSSIDGLEILGPSADQRAGIVSFVVDGVHPQDIAVFIDRQGVAIRAGHHCTMPLHERFGISASCRASFYVYNTEQDIEEFSEALQNVIGKLR